MESFRISVFFKPDFLITKRLLLLFKTHLKPTVCQLSPMFKPLRTLHKFDPTPRIKCRFNDVFQMHLQSRAVFSVFEFQVNINQQSVI